ncbi:hypothetical protein [Streptomyces sp. NPDC051567]|uniref:hypothetical protein n=1 Tax=Streptomyces sp. NPDC051567 TaxID=3365660 RepID=UPI00378C7AD9
MTRDGERPVEHRLRHALDARAQEITVRDLRPARPPGPGVRRFSVERLRRFTLPLAGLTATAAALVGYLVLAPDPAPLRPVPPASPPEFTAPGPVPDPGTPQPSGPVGPSLMPPVSPSATHPGPIRSRYLSPSASPSPAVGRPTATISPPSAPPVPSSPSGPSATPSGNPGTDPRSSPTPSLR